MLDPAPIDLERLLQAEADELLTARNRGSTFHRSRNIRAAGDEVEIAVRQFVVRRLPAAYGVGHGHIVDRRRRTSAQLDVIVHDAMSAALVAKAADGTTYFPYESVLAVGEVKTSYRRSKDPIAAFSDKIRMVRQLERERPGPQSALLRLGFGAGVTLPTGWPYRNPMFSFMVCLESDDFTESEFVRLASAIPRADRPSLICFLDRGVVAGVRRPELGKVEMDWWPEFEAGHAPWEFLEFRGGSIGGLALATLYDGLGEHLSWAAVKAPDPHDYVPELRTHPVWREG